MIKFKLLNGQTLLRALIVCAVAGTLGVLGGLLLSQALDADYRATGSDISYSLFYLFGNYRAVFVAGLCILAAALFSNWILAPSYHGFVRALAKNLRLEEGGSLPALPKPLRALDEDLARLRKDLQLWQYATKEAERRKDELVVYLAHDIRTPLTSVLGYLELLEESPELSPAQRQHFTQTALRKAGRMSELVEELFEVTRFNISQIELCREPVRAGVLLQQLAEEAMPLLEERQLEVQCRAEENLSLFADPGKLARALDNVLQNAARYAPVGSRLRLEARAENGQGVIRIQNEGAEIPKAELDRFFEKFYRGDSARQSQTGGSGLGLAIAQNIVQAHGGTITAQNQNRVTCFTIALPLA